MIAVARLCVSLNQADGVLLIDKTIVIDRKDSPPSESRDSVIYMGCSIWTEWFESESLRTRKTVCLGALMPSVMSLGDTLSLAI